MEASNEVQKLRRLVDAEYEVLKGMTLEEFITYAMDNDEQLTEAEAKSVYYDIFGFGVQNEN